VLVAACDSVLVSVPPGSDEVMHSGLLVLSKGTELRHSGMAVALLSVKSTLPVGDVLPGLLAMTVALKGLTKAC
jgi:hypothetical protein